MAEEGTLEQFREMFIHRSAYQLKEADPHSWALPRLSGKAKAALVEIQADEYGGGRPERMHAQLFADTLAAVGLDARYGAYVEHLVERRVALDVTGDRRSVVGLLDRSQRDIELLGRRRRSRRADRVAQRGLEPVFQRLPERQQRR
jgi:hypothetical protein